MFWSLNKNAPYSSFDGHVGMFLCTAKGSPVHSFLFRIAPLPPFALFLLSSFMVKVMVKESPHKFFQLEMALGQLVADYKTGLEDGMKPCDDHIAMLLAQPHHTVLKARFLSRQRYSLYLVYRVPSVVRSFLGFLVSPQTFHPAPIFTRFLSALSLSLSVSTSLALRLYLFAGLSASLQQLPQTRRLSNRIRK